MSTSLHKVGIFGGSFNPIHVGHLALANYLCEFGGLDSVWFLVTPQNPLKRQDDLLDDCHRLELARMAIQDYAKFHVSDFEFSLPRPSYTIHTLQALKVAYPENELRAAFAGAVGQSSLARCQLHVHPGRVAPGQGHTFLFAAGRL